MGDGSRRGSGAFGLRRRSWSGASSGGAAITPAFGTRVFDRCGDGESGSLQIRDVILSSQAPGAPPAAAFTQPARTSIAITTSQANANLESQAETDMGGHASEYG